MFKSWRRDASRIAGLRRSSRPGGQAERMGDGGGLRKIEDQVLRRPQRRDGPGSTVEVLANTRRTGNERRGGTRLMEGEGSGSKSETRERQWGGDAACNCGFGMGNTDEPRPQGRRLHDGGCADERAAWPSGGAGYGFFPPGPADREAWAAILSERPDLAPAVSRAELIAWRAHLAGLLDLQTVVAAVQADSDPRRSYRDRRSARAVGRAIRKAVAAQKAQSAIRGVADDVAGEMDERVDSLRACGNGVVALQGAAAFVELVRRSGIR
jgi:hypothetical protein